MGGVIKGKYEDIKVYGMGLGYRVQGIRFGILILEFW